MAANWLAVTSPPMPAPITRASQLGEEASGELGAPMELEFPAEGEELGLLLEPLALELPAELLALELLAELLGAGALGTGGGEAGCDPRS